MIHPLAVVIILLIGSFWLGYRIGRWWYPAALVSVTGGVAVFLVANDGWRGTGWGEAEIALNIQAAALALVGGAAGVFARRRL